MQNRKKKSVPRLRTISSVIIATACGALLLIVTTAMGTQISNRVITWGGNTPDWNRTLHLGGLRLGCSDPPASCVNYAQQLAKSQGVGEIFLAILLDANKTPAYAREFSQLSLTHPFLQEVGFDDFASQCQRQKLGFSELSGMLNEVARNLKSANPNLRLGITLYEDELSSSRFPLRNLDEDFRKTVDYVHLYPHYRKEAQKFSASMQQAKELFSSAKIIPGIYAYDRRDYLPCAAANSTPCSNLEELSLFEQSLKERVALLGDQSVGWIEFYPGSFGLEPHWDKWSEPRFCRPERVQECIENTKKMHEAVRQSLNP